MYAQKRELNLRETASILGFSMDRMKRLKKTRKAGEGEINKIVRVYEELEEHEVAYRLPDWVILLCRSAPTQEVVQEAVERFLASGGEIVRLPDEIHPHEVERTCKEAALPTLRRGDITPWMKD